MTLRRWPRTDFGTVAAHWIAVAATVVLALTGLRLTADDVHHPWLRDFDGWLASENLWQRHIVAGIVLSAVGLAYAVYLRRARLIDRIRLDRLRLQGLFAAPAARWSAVNVLLLWAFLAAGLGAIVTGWLAYYSVAAPVLTLHRACTWVILAFPPLHLLSQAGLGGVPQLLRVFRPKRAGPPAEEVDLALVVADLLAERQALQRKAQRKARRAASAAPRSEPTDTRPRP